MATVIKVTLPKIQLFILRLVPYAKEIFDPSLVISFTSKLASLVAITFQIRLRQIYKVDPLNHMQQDTKSGHFLLVSMNFSILPIDVVSIDLFAILSFLLLLLINSSVFFGLTF